MTEELFEAAARRRASSRPPREPSCPRRWSRPARPRSRHTAIPTPLRPPFGCTGARGGVRGKPRPMKTARTRSRARPPTCMSASSSRSGASASRGLEALAQRTSAESTPRALDLRPASSREELGDVARGRAALYERALAATPRHVGALRALAPPQLSRRRLCRAMPQLLERIGEATHHAGERPRVRSPSLRSCAGWYSGTRRRRWARPRKPLASRRTSSATRSCWRASRPAAHARPELEHALAPLAERTQDRALAAIVVVTAGRARETRGDKAGARRCTHAPRAADPFAFDAPALAGTDGSPRSCERRGRARPTPHARELRHRPGRGSGATRSAHMLGCEGSHVEAVALLEHASDDVSLRTALHIALASGDAALQAPRCRVLGDGSDGPERALALLTQAELFADGGELERAERTHSSSPPSPIPGSRWSPSRARRSLDAVATRRGSPRSSRARRPGEARSLPLPSWRHRPRMPLTSLPGCGSGRDRERRPRARAARNGRKRGACTARRGREPAARSEQARQREQPRADAARARAGPVQHGNRARTPARPSGKRPSLLRDMRRPSAPTARTSPGAHETASAYAREAGGRTGPRAAFLHMRAGFALEAGSSERLEAFADACEAAPAMRLRRGPSIGRHVSKATSRGSPSSTHSRPSARAMCSARSLTWCGQR